MRKNRKPPSDKTPQEQEKPVETGWIKIDITVTRDFLPQLYRIIMSTRVKTLIKKEWEREVRLVIFYPFREGIKEKIENLSLFATVHSLKEVAKIPQTIPEIPVWEKLFGILHIGRRIVIKPPWKEYVPAPHEIVLEFEPGGSFGMGYHPTTRLTLELMEKYIKPGMTVLDMGCGSGILSFVAVRMGARLIIAVDREKKAVEDVLLYQKKHGEKIPCLYNIVPRLSQGFEKINGEFDVILINILREFILNNSLNIFNRTKPGGLFITGSVSQGNIEQVDSAMKKQGFEKMDSLYLELWSGLVYRKKI